MTTVAVIDDSAVVRQHLSELLRKHGFEVGVIASDPLFAWPKLRERWPDVIVLDVEMPRMDGITFLKELMAERPTPVVMCSTLTEAGCETTLSALAAGAVGFVTKPKLGLRDYLNDGASELVDAVKAAARSNMKAVRLASPSPARAGAAPSPSPIPTPVRAGAVPGAADLAAKSRPALSAMAETTDRVIAIGLSTGGVQTFETLLKDLPRTMPGIVLVQHMPEKFTGALAKRLNDHYPQEVLEAKDGDRVIAGRVLIAPGGRHMRLTRSGAQYVVEVVNGPLFNHHRPSVDVLFKSVAQVAGRNALGLLMTGMGDDGARGLRDMREKGAWTAAQDEASSIVFGMPAEAIKLGAACEVLGLDQIARRLQDVLKSSGMA
ncbi:MAG: chemotaxis response regulator protein-glutamate methylesterase [Burkholderiaceae bacterium]|nr:MAG: chemotaxis response regulator protein-glutamate methylesterase [Burkholderiaceae bacterium]